MKRARTRPRADAPPEDRRQAILDATLRVIAAEGVQAVTHRKVAELAGVALGSTTYYFSSREHLIRDAFQRYIERTQAWLDALPRRFPTQATAAALVDDLVAVTRRGFEDEPMVLTEYELTLYAARDAEVAAALHAWDAKMCADLAHSLERLGARRPFAAARTLMHLVRGHELDGLARHDADPDGLRRRLRDVMNAMIAVEADAPAPRGRRRGA